MNTLDYKVLDYNKYANCAREVVSNSCVLLRNINSTLPILKNDTVAIFGRSQIETYYSGTGSGGLVNLPYIVNIVDGISSMRNIYRPLLEAHINFIEEVPFDKGKGWAQEPYSQVEYAVSEEEVVNASKNSDIAVMVIGRLAGEDRDSGEEEGAYYLSKIELNNMELICKYFTKTVVLLNVGNVMDMSFIEKYNPTAVLYAWHGGCESGNGYADVLCGCVNPNASLTDTIAYKIEDYPSHSNFGNEDKDFYQEDIYLGYRYFETFAKDKVMFPFGFGLSYTTFALEDFSFTIKEGIYKFNITITNTGNISGKKAVQIYVEAPSINQEYANVKLDKAKRTLISFAKSRELEPGESQVLTMYAKEEYFASFDDASKTLYPRCFVLEEGEYKFIAGFDSRDEKCVSYIQYSETKLIEKVQSYIAPIEAFKRLTIKDINKKNKDEYMVSDYEEVPTRAANMKDRIYADMTNNLVQSNENYSFEDVLEDKCSIFDFVNTLSNLDLIHMSRGEGMCSPKVTDGTAGCIGGVTEALVNKKMPLICCADGPSGIRMDCGTMAFSIPNGTALASTFDCDLVEKLVGFLALELVKNKVDTLLGPGMNIHRHPLCGRNFEYFSEDPILSGKMAISQLKALHKEGVTGTIKHFACNNQEYKRRQINAVVSERALREIYLKGFEIAVKEGCACSIMTAYNPLNGVQTGSHYDLNIEVLRKDWGYKGLVMSDWWADMSFEGQEATTNNTLAMILGGNDVFMVNANALENTNNDNSEEAFSKGLITRDILVRNACHIVETMVRLKAKDNYKMIKELVVKNEPVNQMKIVNDYGVIDILKSEQLDTRNIDTTKGVTAKFAVKTQLFGAYKMKFKLSAIAPELAQVGMTVSANGRRIDTILLKGNTNSEKIVEFQVDTNIHTYIELYFSESGMVIEEIKIFN